MDKTGQAALPYQYFIVGMDIPVNNAELFYLKFKFTSLGITTVCHESDLVRRLLLMVGSIAKASVYL